MDDPKDYAEHRCPKLLRIRGSHWVDTLENVAIFTDPLSMSFKPSTVCMRA